MPGHLDTQCTIRLDTANLDLGATFWHSIMGFEETARAASGTPMERRTLESSALPSFAIELVACRPRPVIGSTLGSLRSLCFKVSDPLATARQAKHAKWIQPIDPEQPAPDSILLIDPSGYRVELVRA